MPDINDLRTNRNASGTILPGLGSVMRGVLIVPPIPSGNAAGAIAPLLRPEFRKAA